MHHSLTYTIYTHIHTGTPKHIVKGTECIRKGEDDEATNYFIDILPRIKQKYCNKNSCSKDVASNEVSNNNIKNPLMTTINGSIHSSFNNSLVIVNSTSTSPTNVGTDTDITVTTTTTETNTSTAITNDKTSNTGVQVIEFIQYAGDTVFIPGGK